MVKLSAVLTAAVLTLSACGPSDDTADADVAFAQSMIPHHEQALEMSELVDGADASPEVQKIATRIQSAQDPEIETMRSWLREWDVADEPGDEMDHGSMDGMMSRDQMNDLERASGPEFDRLWLTSMIEHHRGAMTMAEDVLANGEDPDVADLAQQIIDAQRAEITEMEALTDG